MVTPSQVNQAGALSLNPAACSCAPSDWRSKSTATKRSARGTAMSAHVSSVRFHCWVAG